MTNEYNLKNKTIFDAHSHIGKFGIQSMRGKKVEPFQGREVSNAEEQKSYMEDMGISKVVVVSHYVPDQKVPFEVYNPIVLDVVSKLKNVYGGLWVSPLAENIKLTRKVLDSLPIEKIKVLKMSADSWPKRYWTKSRNLG